MERKLSERRRHFHASTRHVVWPAELMKNRNEWRETEGSDRMRIKRKANLFEDMKPTR